MRLRRPVLDWRWTDLGLDQPGTGKTGLALGWTGRKLGMDRSGAGMGLLWVQGDWSGAGKGLICGWTDWDWGD